MRSLMAHAGGLAMELNDQLVSHYGIEMRNPLMDMRLIEFGLRTPAELMLQGRRHKELMRQAVAELLPDAVRERDVKVGHNETVERDIGMLAAMPPPREWRLVELELANLSELQRLRQQADVTGRLPWLLALMIRAELHWRRREDASVPICP